MDGDQNLTELPINQYKEGYTADDDALYLGGKSKPGMKNSCFYTYVLSARLMLQHYRVTWEKSPRGHGNNVFQVT